MTTGDRATIVTSEWVENNGHIRVVRKTYVDPDRGARIDVECASDNSDDANARAQLAALAAIDRLGVNPDLVDRLGPAASYQPRWPRLHWRASLATQDFFLRQGDRTSADPSLRLPHFSYDYNQEGLRHRIVFGAGVETETGLGEISIAHYYSYALDQPVRHHAETFTVEGIQPEVIEDMRDLLGDVLDSMSENRKSMSPLAIALGDEDGAGDN